MHLCALRPICPYTQGNHCVQASDSISITYLIDISHNIHEVPDRAPAIKAILYKGACLDVQEGGHAAQAQQFCCNCYPAQSVLEQLPQAFMTIFILSNERTM